MHRRDDLDPHVAHRRALHFGPASERVWFDENVTAALSYPLSGGFTDAPRTYNYDGSVDAARHGRCRRRDPRDGPIAGSPPRHGPRARSALDTANPTATVTIAQGTRPCQTPNHTGESTTFSTWTSSAPPTRPPAVGHRDRERRSSPESAAGAHGDRPGAECDHDDPRWRRCSYATSQLSLSGRRRMVTTRTQVVFRVATDGLRRASRRTLNHGSTTPCGDRRRRVRGPGRRRGPSRRPGRRRSIDANNFHLFQPLLYQVATAGLDADDVAYAVRGMFRRQRNVTVQMAGSSAADLDARTVTVDRAGGRDELELRLARGRRRRGGDHLRRRRGRRARDRARRTLDDAIALRRAVLERFERAAVTTRRWSARRRSTWCVCGGGPTGVETAGAMMELFTKVLAKDFPHARRGAGPGDRWWRPRPACSACSGRQSGERAPTARCSGAGSTCASASASIGVTAEAG